MEANLVGAVHPPWRRACWLSRASSCRGLGSRPVEAQCGCAQVARGWTQPASRQDEGQPLPWRLVGRPTLKAKTEEDSGFLGRARLGRLIQAAAMELLEKLNSARTNSPTKIFLVLGFYTANALATILGQTGDWDVLVAGVVVAAIEGIGMLMYRKPMTRPPGRFPIFDFDGELLESWCMSGPFRGCIQAG
ncbi:hypothetical protein U9M48_035067 [Paspalum notatum var. saurae]|uniref:Ycf20-like protein n=1 Tax=Paspalum notatum var. saurae TaxID=547442 RepID=A0AAQ3UBA6_PASNO